MGQSEKRCKGETSVPSEVGGLVAQRVPTAQEELERGDLHPSDRERSTARGILKARS